jgi:hypothetical protein
MGIRGPQSSAAAVISPVADLPGNARPEPPADLTEEHAPSGALSLTACRPIGSRGNSWSPDAVLPARHHRPAHRPAGRAELASDFVPARYASLRSAASERSTRTRPFCLLQAFQASLPLAEKRRAAADRPSLDPFRCR